ncbi:hypothetical protein FA13DRAFT_893543 [Coprinellus micaceus]|uniref:Uncharacterized protein n=1 Tax=Coprinellus micaceus TaxID=71717 RepID=A0A4Y7TST7_COPMI|nr:hypothetical protein FA13DRAFT_893543 [Coprinellus micaceus]
MTTPTPISHYSICTIIIITHALTTTLHITYITYRTFCCCCTSIFFHALSSLAWEMLFLSLLFVRRSGECSGFLSYTWVFGLRPWWSRGQAPEDKKAARKGEWLTNVNF